MTAPQFKSHPDAHPVDAHVGKKIRHFRWLAGVTQQDLAAAVGIRFQQIQKYETGMNRVSASRLYDISKSLNVDISEFFVGLSETETQDEPAFDVLSVFTKINQKSAADLLHSFSCLPASTQTSMLRMIQTLANQDAAPSTDAA
jgi:transcriptional regulator with XRE-family HTH domain